MSHWHVDIILGSTILYGAFPHPDKAAAVIWFLEWRQMSRHMLGRRIVKANYLECSQSHTRVKA